MIDLLKKYLPYLIVLIIGFFVGRATVSTETKIEYVKGKEITGSVPRPIVPDTVYIPLPGQPLFLPIKVDTVYLPGEVMYISQKPDTAAVVADYVKGRGYELNLFDNEENGKLDVSLLVQYNALQSFDYSFAPMTKVVTRTRKQVFQPFVSAGWSTLNYYSAGAGMFYHSFGVEYQYLKGYNGMGDGHLVGVKWKF